VEAQDIDGLHLKFVQELFKRSAEPQRRKKVPDPIERYEEMATHVDRQKKMYVSSSSIPRFTILTIYLEHLKLRMSGS